jgi:hypothetical protein
MRKRKVAGERERLWQREEGSERKRKVVGERGR